MGNFKVVEYLCQQNAQVNCGETEGGWTPLHLAVQGPVPSDNQDGLINNLLKPENAIKTVDLLLKYGATPNAIEKELHRTPLHIAAQSGHHGLVAAILKGKVDQTILDHQGHTALHIAASKDSLASCLNLGPACANVKCQHGHFPHDMTSNSELKQLLQQWQFIAALYNLTINALSLTDNPNAAPSVENHSSDANVNKELLFSKQSDLMPISKEQNIEKEKEKQTKTATPKT